MSIADKLTAIAENEPRVYEAGKLALLRASKYMNATASGAEIALNDVSSVEHGVTVTVSSKNLIDLSQFTCVGCTDNGDGTLTANMSDVFYCRISTGQLNDFFMENRGKSFTFSVKADTTPDTRLVIVIYGERTNGSTYQTKNGTIGMNSITFTPSTGFTKINSIDLRMLGKDARYDDTTTVISDIQLELGDDATAYTPYVEDLSEETVVVGDGIFAVSADGTVTGVRSRSPSMTLGSVNGYLTIECSYLRDIDSYIDSLTAGGE